MAADRLMMVRISFDRSTVMLTVILTYVGCIRNYTLNDCEDNLFMLTKTKLTSDFITRFSSDINVTSRLRSD